jgi:hypothetical protein
MPGNRVGSNPTGARSTQEHPMTDLKAALDRLSTWRTKNADRAGTPEYDKTTVLHRLLTDLIERGGGTAEERAAVLQQIAAG